MTVYIKQNKKRLVDTEKSIHKTTKAMYKPKTNYNRNKIYWPKKIIMHGFMKKRLQISRRINIIIAISKNVENCKMRGAWRRTQ